jgi:hypothetical protein
MIVLAVQAGMLQTAKEMRPVRVSASAFFIADVSGSAHGKSDKTKARTCFFTHRAARNRP